MARRSNKTATKKVAAKKAATQRTTPPVPKPEPPVEALSSDGSSAEKLPEATTATISSGGATTQETSKETPGPVKSADIAEPVPPQAKSCGLAEKTKEALVKTLSTYLVRDIDEATLCEVEDAIAANKQPCVVKLTGGRGFDLQVFDRPFNRRDVSGDVPGKHIALNISRRLTRYRMYPGA